MHSKFVLACLVLVLFVAISSVLSAPTSGGTGNKLQSSNVKTNLKGGYGGYGGYGGHGGYGGYDYGYGYDYCDPYYDPYCDYYDY